MLPRAAATLPDFLLGICRRIEAAGGHAWLVGGSVRDLLRGRSPKDFDLEVYKLDETALYRVLRALGHCEEVGRQFGVLKLWIGEHEVDVALPRTERKAGTGHRSFDVRADPQLTPAVASERRDFTINAMMLDPLNGKLLDLHGGRDDLERGILRHVSLAFAEDPLRPLRGMQFAARFNMRLDPETARLCQNMLNEADSLPVSRIWGEWQKWAHAAFPSRGLEALQTSGWLALYPELTALCGCPQDPRWHPEGDVWTHTCLVTDRVAHIADARQLEKQARELLIFSALCHDLGKPETTERLPDGGIVSPRHSEVGLDISQRLLHRIGAPQRLIAQILPLVRNHMVHMHGEPTPRAVRRLAHRLEPSSITLWEMLVEADASGRSPAPPSRPAYNWLQLAEVLDHQLGKPQPIVNGHLLIELGMQPGPAMGRMLKAAYEAQLDGDIDDAETARNWCIAHLSDTG